MTHELAVHRWDAQAAAGEPEPLADAVAARTASTSCSRSSCPIADVSAVDGSLHLHATDGDGEWFIETADGLTWSHAHEKGDVAVRGTTSDLLLRPVGPAATTTPSRSSATPTVLDRWRAATRF